MLLSQFPATLRLRCLAGIRAAVAGGQNYTPGTAAAGFIFWVEFVHSLPTPQRCHLRHYTGINLASIWHCG